MQISQEELGSNIFSFPIHPSPLRSLSYIFTHLPSMHTYAFLKHTLADHHLSELEFARPDRGQERSVFVVLTPAPATTSISDISKFPDLHVSNRG